MSWVEYFGVALDSFKQNRVRSFLTMVGVTIGVLAVVLLVALGEGAQAYVAKEFADLGTNLLIITPGKQETSGMMPIVAGSFRKLTYDNAKEIERRGVGIKDVSPEVVGAGAVRYSDRERNCMVFGVSPAIERIRDIHCQQGRFINETDLDKNLKVCVLGSQLKEELFGTKNALYERVSINRSKHLVVGILEKKGVTLGINADDIAVVPLLSAQQMFYGGEDELYQIVVQASSPDDTSAASASVREILTAAHDYTEDFTIIDQTTMLATLDKIFMALKVMLSGIASISLLVGGIGIMNIMLVSVRERTREVGIRKAVGATRRDIGLQFVIEAITLSCFGGVVGIVLAYGGTSMMRLLYPQFPVYPSTWSIIVAFAFSATVGVFFGAYPALKAASVDPVEALRYE
ncbi:MAG: ABC transporter permease [Candidatus Hydrogenedentes bacterium]|nr:ABC transporter permease [Candidatus Hydrogenedentota bacterium]